MVFFRFFCFCLTAKITAAATSNGMDRAIRTCAMVVAVVFIYANAYIREYYEKKQDRFGDSLAGASLLFNHSDSKPVDGGATA
jgi:hypothetical protein